MGGKKSHKKEKCPCSDSSSSVSVETYSDHKKKVIPLEYKRKHKIITKKGSWKLTHKGCPYSQ